MNAKIGDSVRYLNSVGGGIVVRIEGDMAFVDDEGFETPVLLRECVVVKAASPAQPQTAAKPTPQSKYQAPAPARERPTALPVVETAGGDSINIVLGFEPSDLKTISQATFDAYIVNDSNYYLYVSVATREAASKLWTPRFDGLIEPNIQEFAFELTPGDLPAMDRVAVQYLAFKRSKDFEAKRPAFVEMKIDTTKFAKVHCFRPNPYFDVPVIAFDISSNDRPADPEPVFEAAEIERGMREKRRAVTSEERSRAQAARSTPSKSTDSIIEVDLHADSLLDTTAGLSAADILNLQIDRFTEVMKQNLGRPGQRIVFIHGKGEGVLRQALMKELTHRFKGHDVQDASFREYGFGATQVTIRRT
ncbi:MAG: DUF2027 domain-containing protein, partial [Muribaculaceae bacterium]|nr:DUF2027 domain-containing protein [Muribaculaceae bacterium]